VYGTGASARAVLELSVTIVLESQAILTLSRAASFGGDRGSADFT
jgi:hypothetical protein